MKKHFGLLLVAILTIFSLLMLSGCIDAVTLAESEPLATDIAESIEPVESIPVDEYIEFYDDYETGFDDWLRCERHDSTLFHHFGLFAGTGVLNNEEVRAWADPLREIELETGECLVNMVTLIQQFNIPRETLQGIIDNNIHHYFRHGGETLNVLYGGDWALIDEFFAVGGQAWQQGTERSRSHWVGQIMEAQQLVYKNITEMSRYFHDIWTYSHFLGGQDTRVRWMHGLIDAGEYNRVNVVDFINHFGLDRPSSLSPGLTIFEHWATQHNMNIFTHYNFDVLLSGDWDLIRSYYSIENEHLHTAAVQARFDAHVERYGMPDTSWMLPVTPPQPLPGSYVRAIIQGADINRQITGMGFVLDGTNLYRSNATDELVGFLNVLNSQQQRYEFILFDNGGLLLDSELNFASSSAIPPELIIETVEYGAVTLRISWTLEALRQFTNVGAVRLQVRSSFSIMSSLELHVDIPWSSVYPPESLRILPFPFGN